MRRDLPREAVGKPRQKPLVFFLARADHHELDAPLHQPLGDVAQKIQPLVPRQPRHDRQHGDLAVLRQTQRPLERKLILVLSLAHGLGAVMRLHAGALRGVKQVGVDAVRDARERAAAAAQHVRQPVGIVGVLQLLGVGARNGVHTVGGHDASLEEVRAVVKAQNFVALRRQPQHVVVELQVALALIFDVVDGEHAARVRQRPGVLGLQQQRHERRLPVVAVDDVGRKVEEFDRREHRLAEIRKALAVVAVTVDAAVAAEVVLVVDKIDLELFPPRFQPHHAHIFPPPRERHVKAAEKFRLILAGVFDRAVIRQKQRHLVFRQPRERQRQRLHDVSQPAGLDIRRCLGGSDGNFHRLFAPLLILAFFPMTSGCPGEPSSSTPGSMTTFLSRMT